MLSIIIEDFSIITGNVEISYSLTFHGLTLEGGVGARELTLVSSEGITRIDVTSRLHTEEVIF